MEKSLEYEKNLRGPSLPLLSMAESSLYSGARGLGFRCWPTGGTPSSVRGVRLTYGHGLNLRLAAQFSESLGNVRLEQEADERAK